MKRTILTISLAAGVLVAMPSPAGAATFVGGNIVGQTWTSNASPYCVTSDVYVASLNIRPGVDVKFLSNYVFEVAGVLRAQGSAGQKVVFTSTNATVGWKGILFRNSSPGSFFSHCRIERANMSGLRITNSTPAFTNCDIANNSTANAGGGICASITDGDLILEGCTLTNNTSTGGGALYARLVTGRLRMAESLIARNAVNPASAAGTYGGGGLYIDGDAQLFRCRIEANTCRGRAPNSNRNYYSLGGGVYARNGELRFVNCILSGNQATASRDSSIYNAQANGGALYFESGAFTSTNCLIVRNVVSAPNGSWGAGTFLSAGQADFVNCTFSLNNTHAIYNNGTTVGVRNSILYFNNNDGVQVAGTASVVYSDVQNGYAGEGNINQHPILACDDFIILPGSPCVDAGDPNPIYNDVCIRDPFAPNWPCVHGSLESVRNDMGTDGGPGACGWNVDCPPPAITAHPQSKLACVGQSATFSVSATGTGLSYQWYHNTNTPLPGATGQTLTLNNVHLADAGTYHVVVSGQCGEAVASQAAGLLVSQVWLSIELYAGLTFTNLATGQTYWIKYTTDLSNSNAWQTATSFIATGAEGFWMDPQPARQARRFYRVTTEP